MVSKEAIIFFFARSTNNENTRAEGNSLQIPCKEQHVLNYPKLLLLRYSTNCYKNITTKMVFEQSSVLIRQLLI